MRRVLYLEDPSSIGASRFRKLETALARDVAVQCIKATSDETTLSASKRTDFLVADRRGLALASPELVSRLIQASPDAIVILLAECRDSEAAQAVHDYGAIDCLCWSDGYDLLAESLQGVLTRLTLARSAIQEMTSLVKEFDVTLSFRPLTDDVSMITKYALSNLAQMDVCGLRSQFRTIRVLSELLEKLKERSVESGISALEPVSAVDTPSVVKDVSNKSHIRIHVSKSGIRLSIQFLPQSESEQGCVLEFATCDLWYAPLFMDDIEFDGHRNELSMLMHPDHVSKHVTQAIADRRRDGPRHDILSHVLDIVDERDDG